MSDERPAEPPALFAAYQVQDTKYGRRVFRAWRLALACVLLAFAAIFGWAVFFFVPGLRVVPPFPILGSFLVLILVFLAAFRNEPGLVYIGAAIGLIFLGFPTLATVLNAFALVVVRRTETTEPVAGNV